MAYPPTVTWFPSTSHPDLTTRYPKPTKDFTQLILKASSPLVQDEIRRVFNPRQSRSRRGGREGSSESLGANANSVVSDGEEFEELEEEEEPESQARKFHRTKYLSQGVRYIISKRDWGDYFRKIWELDDVDSLPQSQSNSAPGRAHLPRHRHRHQESQESLVFPCAECRLMGKGEWCKRPRVGIGCIPCSKTFRISQCPNMRWFWVWLLKRVFGVDSGKAMMFLDWVSTGT